jgi:hypothetical protein
MGEGESLGSSGRAECARSFGRAGVGRAGLAPSFDAWDRSQHSPIVDEAFACSSSPRGRGRGEGEGFVRFSIASSTLQVTLPIPPKIAENRVHVMRQEAGREARPATAESGVLPNSGKSQIRASEAKALFPLLRRFLVTCRGFSGSATRMPAVTNGPSSVPSRTKGNHHL